MEHASFELPLEKAAFAPEPPIVSGVLSLRVRLFKTLILIVWFDCLGTTNQSIAKTTKAWDKTLRAVAHESYDINIRSG